MRSSNKTIVAATEQRLSVCMNALKEVSKVWLVAKMVHTLFESILGNKLLEERLQKAAGKRHRKQSHAVPTIKPKEDSQMQSKRKFDDMNDMSFSNGPAQNVSYERSRPQTPALTPSREPTQQQQLQQNQQMPPQSTSPHLNRQSASASAPPDFSMPGPSASNHNMNGNGASVSRGGTRPTTPFNQYAFPGTPPELFLVTRNSPNISSDLWQNFQPDQLFPNEANVTFPQISPIQSHSGLVDPALGSRHQQGQMGGFGGAGGQSMMGQGLGGLGASANDPSNSWTQLDHLNQPAMPGDDSWSNSSKGHQGPIVPTTLNVEDW